MSAPVAVVGLACRFPGAPDAERFWRILRTGSDAITRRPNGDGQNGADYVSAYGSLYRSRLFDWRFFRYSRGEAASIDPQQRVFLEVAAQALDDAAIDPDRAPGPIGVFGGCDPPTAAEADETAWDKDFLTSRTAYKMGLQGPAVTVQTGCSTSLAAVHLACRSLCDGECDVALAGGVRLAASADGYRHIEGGVLASDGVCRPFAAEATGTVPAEGAGVVVLRRLDDALRDGHDIAAMIRGSAINNDGSAKVGFTAPSVAGQREVIERALARAEVRPSEIEYIEAHGTGTRLGDPIEVAALTEAFRKETRRSGYCGLGSVKGNIGHAGSASGVAGLIKTILMLEHGEMVPTLNAEPPNPELGLATSPFFLVSDTRAWAGPAVAGVSSLGMGGTNVHAIVASAPSQDPGRARPGPRLLCLSAHTPKALDDYIATLRERLRARAAPHVADVASTLSEGRRALPLRRALVVEDRDEADRELRKDVLPVAASDPAEVVLLFPGQGTVRAGSGLAATEALPVVRRVAEHARTVLRERHGITFQGGTADDADTLIQQVSLFTLGYGLWRQLQEWGLRPVAALGSSLGEYTAVAAAGLWTFEDALNIVVRRATAMRACPPGRMLAVGLPPADVVSAMTEPLSVAIEDIGRTVLSGPEAAITRERERWDRRGVPCTVLATRLAFHSPSMRPAAEAVDAAVRAAETEELSFPVMSNLTGGRLDAGCAADPAYWAEHMCATVRLARNAGDLLAEGHDLYAELGPGSSLLGTLRRHTAWARGTGVPLLGSKPEHERIAVLRAAGILWTHGARIDIPRLNGDPVRRRRHLPGPPLERLSLATEPLRDTAPPDTAPPGTAPPVRRTSAGENRSNHVLAELWIDALGVGDASPDDDFYRLGGDSLALVRMAAQVRERLGTHIDVGSFAARPTFAHLQRLAASPSAAAQDGPAQLSRGSMPVPVIFAPPVTGSSIAYQRLVETLDGWTCYGFDTPGLMPGEDHPGAVEMIAADHVRRLGNAYPEGACVLAGWSMGAVVAHEMARQLARHNRRVELLVCVDGHPPPLSGVPVAAHPGYLTDALRQRRHLFRALRDRPGRRPAAPDTPIAELLRTTEGILDIAGVLRRNLRALLRYRPRPAPCPAVILRAGRSAAACNLLARRLAPLYPQGVRVLPIAGDHWSLLTPTGAEDLGRHFRTALAPIAQAHRNRSSRAQTENNSDGG